MAERKGFDLGEYVEVKDRIARFYDLFGQGRLVTHRYELTAEPDGKPKVIVQAHAYRTPDDPLPGVGTSWMYLPGGTPYTKGSEIENVETSAWGRAIGALGILIDRSIASANEVASKADPGVKDRVADYVAAERKGQDPDDPDEPVYQGPWSETGHLIVRKSGPADGELRPGPEGPFLLIAFGTVDQKQLQLEVRGQLAQDLVDAEGGKLDGLVCTIEGDLYRVPWQKAGKPMPPYQRLVVSRIKTDGYSLPAPEPTVPMFPDLEAEKELDGLLP